MLTLQLTLDNGQVTLRANERQSHTFSLHDLNVDLKNFVKDPRPYGEKLFQTLFKDGSEARKAFDELSKQTERTIVLVLESSELDGIAWEYAYHDNAYVVEDFSFIRALPEKERPNTNKRMSKSVERLPLLFIPANPLVDLNGEPTRELDIESEWREMTQHIVKSNAPFDLIELRPATPETLQSVMARFQNGMIAHFSGHGAVTKDGAFLLFENENGSSNPLEAREFVREVKDQAWIGFLSACQSAVAERTAFGNLARELVKAGVPFALGMQFNLPDPFAPNISGQFYNYLSQGHAVPEAARQARRAVKREHEFYVGMIALYVAHPDEVGKMGWSGSGARTLSTFAAADVSDLPTPSGFIGRQRELMNIGTSLLAKKKPNTVTLHGAGGIGKTALMRQTLLRFAPSFELALVIALDPLPSLENVLGRLERFLNLPSPCSNDTKEREKIVRERLTSKRTLVGLDNFETLNYALNNKDSEEEKTAKSLHSFFKYLAANSVTLCVTSREVTNLPGETIEDVQGLTSENGGRLFQENVVRQKDEIYIEKTQQVSKMVGGHPLALRLLAAAFDDQVGTSLDQYIESLQSFLPKARDKWTEEDRHESLHASFNFTMNNLVKTKEGIELQIALFRLSIFNAPFYEFTALPVLKAHTFESIKDEKMAREHTANVLQVLWERGLLERKPMPTPDGNFYFYQTHLALRFLLTEKIAPEDLQEAKKGFLEAMSILAFMAEEQLNKNPLVNRIAISAIFDLLSAAKEQKGKDAALMQFRLSKLLQHIGMYSDALSLLLTSRDFNQSQNDLRGVAATMLEIANVYFVQGNLDKAMETYKKSLDIDKSIGDTRGQIRAMHEMAYILYIRGDVNTAMEFCQNSIDTAESSGNLEAKNSALLQMGYFLRMYGDLGTAVNYYLQSLAISEKLGDLQSKSSSLYELAIISRTQGDLDKALNYLEQSLNISDALIDMHNRAAIFHEMAGIYFIRSQFDKAMSLFEQSLELSQGMGDLLAQSSTLLQMARIYRTRGDLNNAMHYFQNTLNIKDDLDDKNGVANSLCGIAEIYLLEGKLDDAKELYTKALNIFNNLGQMYGKSNVLLEIGRILHMEGYFNDAIKIYNETIDLCDNLGNLQGKSAALHQKANTLRKIGDFDNAMELYQESVQLKSQLGDMHGMAISLSMMGEVLWSVKSYGGAIYSMAYSIYVLEQLNADIQTQQIMKNDLVLWRQELGVELFNQLWIENVGQKIPNWLLQPPRLVQGMRTNQFILGAIQSTKKNHSEAEGYFNSAQKMTADPNTPAEMRVLGMVLLQIMSGEKNVDLSALPREFREMVEKALSG
ncbi:MAG: tetratricopeptide repeat protein [Anaerolineales bacterium]|nr:tetratricopeptide repeat protein [Anaerolineales bacterium]